jgi:nuclease S1
LSVVLAGQVHELQLELNSLFYQLRIVPAGLLGKLFIELRGHGLKLTVVSGGEQKERDCERDHRDQKTKRRQVDSEFHWRIRWMHDDQQLAVELPRRYAAIIIKHAASVKAKGSTRPSEPIMPYACARRLSYRSWFSVGLALLVALQTTTPACAWGRLGHRVISRLAEKRLTPKAEAAIAALLDEGESIADASTWADENRRRLPKTAPWHYVDVPLDEPRYDRKWSADDPKKGCVVDKIHEFKATLRDPSKSLEDRRFALRFLIHCVEDMHMPLHVGDNHDRGGNDTQVRFYDRGTNMHGLWDTGRIERVSKDEEHWVKELTVLPSLQSRDATSGGTVEDWATESLLAAREAYINPATNQRINPGTKLSDAYLEKSLPIVRQRLYQAGMRLAKVLNEAFSAD